jgi:uncharacterized protein YecT (DUF1311 family)
MRHLIAPSILFILVALPITSATAAAAQTNAETEPSVCKTQSNTVEMVQCADWHYKRTERWLNESYQATRKSRDKQNRKLLQDAQLAWIAFRDTECRLARDAARGGTMASILQISCLTTITAKRARELQPGTNSLTGPIHPIAYEKSSAAVLGPFTCEAQILEARIGLVAITPPDKGLVRARLSVGQHVLEWPVSANKQDAFCGVNISLSVIPNKKRPLCPTLRVDDGLCDAFFVQWDKKSQKFTWTRK